MTRNPTPDMSDEFVAEYLCLRIALVRSHYIPRCLIHRREQDLAPCVSVNTDNAIS